MNILLRLSLWILNKGLGKEITKITENLLKGTTYNSKIFEVIDDVQCISLQTPLLTNDDVHGLYFFIVNNSFQINPVTFNSANHGSKFKTKSSPNILKDSIFYLGKSYTLYSRLNEHIFGANTTYSLQLNDASRVYIIPSLRYRTFQLRRKYEKYSPVILSWMESKLHDVLKPPVGSKR